MRELTIWIFIYFHLTKVKQSESASAYQRIYAWVIQSHAKSCSQVVFVNWKKCKFTLFTMRWARTLAAACSVGPNWNGFGGPKRGGGVAPSGGLRLGLLHHRFNPHPQVPMHDLQISLYPTEGCYTRVDTLFIKQHN